MPASLSVTSSANARPPPAESPAMTMGWPSSTFPHRASRMLLVRLRRLRETVLPGPVGSRRTARVRRKPRRGAQTKLRCPAALPIAIAAAVEIQDGADTLLACRMCPLRGHAIGCDGVESRLGRGRKEGCQLVPSRRGVRRRPAPGWVAAVAVVQHRRSRLRSPFTGSSTNG